MWTLLRLTMMVRMPLFSLSCSAESAYHYLPPLLHTHTHIHTGRTAVHWAAMLDNLEALKLLIRQGPDTLKDAQDNKVHHSSFLLPLDKKFTLSLFSSFTFSLHCFSRPFSPSLPPSRPLSSSPLPPSPSLPSSFRARQLSSWLAERGVQAA